jgi:hypothetical protein
MKTANLTPETKALHASFKAGEIDEQTLDDTIESLGILPPQKQAFEVLTTENGLDPYLKLVREKLDDFLCAAPLDMSIEDNRQAYRREELKLIRIRNAYEKIGKTVAATAKLIPKKIDTERKRSWDLIESWESELMAPVEAWKAEQARIEAEAKAKQEAEAIAAEIEFYHEIALLQNEKFDHQRAEAARLAEAARVEADRLAEQQRIEREQRIAAEAAEKAKRDAEESARLEREASERKVLEAKLAQERAEREKLEAEQRAKQAAERAEIEKQQALQRAEEDRIRAVQAELLAERKRQQDEADRIAAEETKRAANKAHQKKINNESLDDLIEFGLQKDTAIKLITAIAKGTIRNITVNY